MKLTLEELVTLYREKKGSVLADIYAFWMILLERTDTVSPSEKEKIQEGLSMYSQLWNESPIVQRMKAEAELGLAQRLFVRIVNALFPTLTELAQQKVEQLEDVSVLEQLILQVVTTSDEDAARGMLDSTIA